MISGVELYCTDIAAALRKACDTSVESRALLPEVDPATCGDHGLTARDGPRHFGAGLPVCAA